MSDGKTYGLTPQQEKFAQAVAAGRSFSDAYREAYATGKMKAKTVNEEACRLAKDPKIAARVAEIRKPVIEEVKYELKDALREAEEARILALAIEQPAAAVSASKLKSQLTGLLIERTEVGGPGSFDNLTDEQIDAQLRAREEALAAIESAQRGEPPVKKAQKA